MGETRAKRGVATLETMFRAIIAVPSVVADYTVGTVIVLVHLAIKGRSGRRELEGW